MAMLKTRIWGLGLLWAPGLGQTQGHLPRIVLALTTEVGWHMRVPIRLPDLHRRGSIYPSLSPFKLASQIIRLAFLLVNTTQTLCSYNS